MRMGSPWRRVAVWLGHEQIWMQEFGGGGAAGIARCTCLIEAQEGGQSEKACEGDSGTAIRNGNARPRVGREQMVPPSEAVVFLLLSFSSP